MKQPKIPTLLELKEILGIKPISPISIATRKYKGH